MQNLSMEVKFPLCGRVTCCIWRSTGETALSSCLCYHIHQWMWKEQDKHNKKQTPNISKGASLGPSQYWGFGKLRAEDIKVFSDTLCPMFRSSHSLQETVLDCQSCLHTKVRLEGAFGEITFVYTEPYRQKVTQLAAALKELVFVYICL